MNSPIRISGQIVDLFQGRIYPGSFQIEAGVIRDMRPEPEAKARFLVPGFVDAHVHIESSLLVPGEFARLAVRHGTVATVSDPHEIANVLGLPGVHFMLDNARQTPFKFHFTAPSCVPATPFETTGASFGPAETAELLRNPEIVGLSEMMNIPGVLNEDSEVAAKLQAAASLGKPVDGHAPELRGEAARTYIQAGISSDHECVSLPEAREKLAAGMKVQIREGSAARNLDDLLPLLEEDFENCMLCSDDKHPDDLQEGHINLMIRRAIQSGIDPLKVFWSACVTPVLHYDLPVGLLRPGDPADFVVLDDLEGCEVLETWIDGQRVAARGKCLLPAAKASTPNRFQARPVIPEQFRIRSSRKCIPVMEVIEGQLVTRHTEIPNPVLNGPIQPDPDQDLLKICVVNRYQAAEPAVALIRGFGLKAGALASSVAHDSHNIVAVGSSDEFLAEIVNLLIQHRGGLAAIHPLEKRILPLPVGGIMSDGDADEIAFAYAALDGEAKKMGSPLRAPFMTLSFMALLVIPDLKLSDRGLFDGKRFKFLPAFEIMSSPEKPSA